MATRSSILAWEIPWIEEPGGLQSMGSQSRTQLSTHTHNFTLQDSACEGWGIASINTVQIPCPSGANIVVVGGRGTQETKYTTPLYILWGGEGGV